MTSPLEKIMTHKMISVAEKTPALAAVQIMIEKHIHHLPVVSQDGELVGVLFKKDLRIAQAYPEITADQLMTTDFGIIDKDTPISTAALKMIEGDVTCLFVIGENSEPLGLLTTSDLLFHLSVKIESENKISKSPLKLNLSDLPSIGALAQKIADMGI